MTETSTTATTAPKKSRKKYVVIAIIIGVLAYLDYSKFNYVLGKGDCSATDTTSVATSVPVISVADSIKLVTPAVADTTKK